MECGRCLGGTTTTGVTCNDRLLFVSKVIPSIAGLGSWRCCCCWFCTTHIPNAPLHLFCNGRELDAEDEKLKGTVSPPSPFIEFDYQNRAWTSPAPSPSPPDCRHLLHNRFSLDRDNGDRLQHYTGQIRLTCQVEYIYSDYEAQGNNRRRQRRVEVVVAALHHGRFCPRTVSCVAIGGGRRRRW